MKKSEEEGLMVTYDPAIIRSFAQALYDRAAIITFAYTAIAVVIGGVIGKGLWGTGPMFLLAVIAGAVGYLVGSARAFILKLEAQLALCQLEIEANTRQLTSSSQVGMTEMIQSTRSIAAAVERGGKLEFDPSGASYVQKLEALGFTVTRMPFGFSITSPKTGGTTNVHSVDALRVFTKAEATKESAPLE